MKKSAVIRVQPGPILDYLLQNRRGLWIKDYTEQEFLYDLPVIDRPAYLYPLSR